MEASYTLPYRTVWVLTGLLFGQRWELGMSKICLGCCSIKDKSQDLGEEEALIAYSIEYASFDLIF